MTMSGSADDRQCGDTALEEMWGKGRLRQERTGESSTALPGMHPECAGQLLMVAETVYTRKKAIRTSGSPFSVALDTA